MNDKSINLLGHWQKLLSRYYNGIVRLTLGSFRLLRFEKNDGKWISLREEQTIF